MIWFMGTGKGGGGGMAGAWKESGCIALKSGLTFEQSDPAMCVRFVIVVCLVAWVKGSAGVGLG